jgi:hypothetical protein
MSKIRYRKNIELRQNIVQGGFGAYEWYWCIRGSMTVEIIRKYYIEDVSGAAGS